MINDPSRGSVLFKAKNKKTPRIPRIYTDSKLFSLIRGICGIRGDFLLNLASGTREAPARNQDSTAGVVFPFGMALELGAIEIDLPEIARGVPLRLIFEVA